MTQPSAQPRTPFSALARLLIADFAAARPLHANSLLVTLYGDTICPFGGTLWLGSLIKLVEPLGISERLVRTSVYRLTEKHILTSRQLGRRSYYTLTGRGLRQFASASRRIYAPAPPPWQGGWQLVMTALGDLDTEQRDVVRKELVWLGFSRLAAGVYIHPTADPNGVRRMLQERGLHEQVALLQGSVDACDTAIANRLISRSLEQQQTEADYRAFIACFEPLLLAVQAAAVTEGDNVALEPELCFLVRTLLIHKYRHILLREAERPAQLLPEDAAGWRARHLTRELYLALSAPADDYFLSVAESVTVPLSLPAADYYARFGGIGPNDSGGSESLPAG